jgi:hypothetical protein
VNIYRLKLPILKAEHCVAGWITAILAGILCHVWRFFLLPGWEYSTAVFLVLTTVILALFSEDTSKPANQVIIMIYVVGTGILLIGSRFEVILDGMNFGPSSLPVNQQVGVLSGLLWLVPVASSFRLSHRFSQNVYARSLFGAVLLLAPTLFMLMSSEAQMLFAWRNYSAPYKALILWFVGGFFFHYVANQMGVERRNPIATRIYFVYLGFFLVAAILNVFHYS